MHSQPPTATVPSPLEREQYAPALNEIRRQRRLAWMLLWSYVPVVALVAIVWRTQFDSYVGPMVIACLWLAGFMYSAARIAWARCPRCGERFHARARSRSVWTRQCMNCGLDIKADQRAA